MGLIPEFVATRNENLRTNQIHTSDFLGHRVLDLDAWIDFDEIEFVGFGIEQELYRSGTVVVDFPRDGQGRFVKFRRNLFAKIGSRCNLDYLLVSALNRAIPFVQMDDVSMLITEDLNFEVSCPTYEFF